MTVKLLFLIIVALVEVANSQYYGPTAPGSYQPYNYYPSATSPVSPSMYPPSATSPVSPSMYSPPAYLSTSSFTPSPTFTPQSFYATPFPSIGSSKPFSAPSSTYNYATMPMFTPPQIPMYPPMYASPIPYAPVPNYAPVPTIPPKYPTAADSSKPAIGAPKSMPPTAIAYYLTTPIEAPKGKKLTEKAKEITEEKLPPPAYPCPFCTGFVDVPKNSKVQPPPPCSSVLPGILEKIPTILPVNLKIKDLIKDQSKFAKPTSPLLADLFEHKLMGKLRFDEDLLDGFLTGLGLGKYND